MQKRADISKLIIKISRAVNVLHASAVEIESTSMNKSAEKIESTLKEIDQISLEFCEGGLILLLIKNLLSIIDFGVRFFFNFFLLM